MKNFAVTASAAFLLMASATTWADALPEVKALKEAAGKCQQPEFKKYLASLEQKFESAQKSTDTDVRKEGIAEVSSAIKVAQDMAANGNKDILGNCVYYTVPAMSNTKRTMYTYPADGKISASLRVIAAKGEFEPASFVLYPFADASKVELKVGELSGKNGKIPASAIDIKIIKIWYQTGVAWYSYFADTNGRELVPELLLNDENLVKVDRKTKDNYLRAEYPAPRGTEYIWISNQMSVDVPINDQIEPVADAKELKPFTLKTGEFKQIWVTVHAPLNAEGIYKGAISVTADGKAIGAIPLEVRVLPFELPKPKTNYDITREYYTSIYNSNNLKEYCKKNGMDLEKAKKRLFNEYVNMKNHNILYPMVPEITLGDEKMLEEQMAVYMKAGLATDAIFGSVPAIPPYWWLTSPDVRQNPMEKQPMPEDLIKRIDRGGDIMKKIIGHTNIYCFGWDEPGMGILTAQRKPWKYLQEKGLKTYSTAHDGHLTYGGYNEDFVNYGGSYAKDTSDKWHAFGGRITSYASPHTGPENPDFVRRTHGLDQYKANCDGVNNYMLNGSSWNDFVGAEYNFRSFNWVYPAVDGPVDTIEYEGFREAIDDVRYATLLKQLAEKAIATGKVDNIYQARMALQWLAMLDPKNCDLNAARLEMISYILKLKDCK